MAKKPTNKPKPRDPTPPQPIEIVNLESKKVAPMPEWLWDRPGVAERVDGYWLRSPDEIAHRKRLAQLVARHAKPDESLIEVGCGTGLVYAALADALPGLSYTGIDRSPAMLAIAKQRYPDAMFRLGDAAGLDYPDGWFDVAVAFEVFGHFADFSQYLAELVRVAKRLAVFTVWLGSRPEIVPGSDHYEHPHDGVLTAIARVTGGKGVVILEDMGNCIQAFVIEKVAG